MSVYFLYSEETNRVKIGYSSNPESRISNIRTSSPTKLEPLLIMNGTEEEEKMLHRKFENERVHGEWFEYSPRIKKCVKEFTEIQENIRGKMLKAFRM